MKASSQVVTAARQLLTHRWWNDERTNYELVVSQYAIDEASAFGLRIITPAELLGELK